MTGYARVSPALLLALALLRCNQAPRTTPGPAASASSSERPPTPNVVQSEMRLLHEALRDSVTAIANGTLAAIPERLEAIDAARKSTERAVETGEYRLPRNAGDLVTFEQLDDRFHEALEALGAKAETGDAAATSAQLGVVLSQCGGCHGRFRP